MPAFECGHKVDEIDPSSKLGFNVLDWIDINLGTAGNSLDQEVNAFSWEAAASTIVLVNFVISKPPKKLTKNFQKLHFIAINAQKRLTKYSPRERKRWVVLAYHGEATFSIKLYISTCYRTLAGSGVVPDTPFFHPPKAKVARSNRAGSAKFPNKINGLTS